MTGYFGTDQQIKLQRAADDAFAWMSETPGACNPGRFLGTDDPERLSWDKIYEVLERDQVFGFRLTQSGEVDNVVRKLSERGYRIDFWDVFVAGRIEAERATSSVLSDGLPNGFKELSSLKNAGHANTKRVQVFMASNGIVPFSGSMLVGEFGPATTVVVLDQSGELAATAHGYFPHNAHSPHHRVAWGGLVAVSPEHRGVGLGKYINAKMIANCFSLLRAKTVHEFVAKTNIPSRKMVESSGLQLDPTCQSGIAVAAGGRFTS